jgi:hypothetical protein
MKFSFGKLTEEAIARLAFALMAAIAFGYFQAQMSPPANLEPGQKIEQSYTIRCQKGECEYKKTTSFDEINP